MHIEKELNYRYIMGDCRELLRKVLLALSDPVGLHGQFECFPELPFFFFFFFFYHIKTSS